MNQHLGRRRRRGRQPGGLTSSLSLKPAMLAEGARSIPCGASTRPRPQQARSGGSGSRRCAVSAGQRHRARRTSISMVTLLPARDPPLRNRLVTIDEYEALPEFVSRLESGSMMRPSSPPRPGLGGRPAGTRVNEHTAGLIEKSGIIEVTPDTKVVIQDSALSRLPGRRPRVRRPAARLLDDAGTGRGGPGWSSRPATPSRSGGPPSGCSYDAGLAVDVILACAEGMAPTELTADDLVAADR